MQSNSFQRQEKKISVQHINGWWKDTGRPVDHLGANQLVLDDLDSKVEGIIDSSCRIMGNVVVGKNTVIKSSTRIKVIIGEVCEIGQNVYIGPYTSIDDDVQILSGQMEP